MGKTTLFILIFSVVSLVLYMYGVLQSGGNSLLTLLINPGNITTINAIIATGWIGASIAAGVGIGLLTKSPEYGFATSWITGFFFPVMLDFIPVYTKIELISPPLALLIFAPILVLVLCTGADYMTGRSQ